MSFEPIDGNMLDLARYEREQDKLDQQEAELTRARAALAEDMIEAYFSGNQAVIDWITDDLMSDHYKAVEAALRRAVIDPEFDIKRFWRDLVTKYIEDDSETDDLDSIEMSRRGFGI